MWSLLFGLLCVAGGVGVIMVCRPRDGNLHPVIRMPGMETTVALLVVCLLAAGSALIVSAFLGG